MALCENLWIKVYIVFFTLHRMKLYVGLILGHGGITELPSEARSTCGWNLPFVGKRSSL
jgi:hypothetical protein